MSDIPRHDSLLDAPLWWRDNQLDDEWLAEQEVDEREFDEGLEDDGYGDYCLSPRLPA